MSVNAHINRIIPRPTLGDLAQSGLDIDNDILILLHYLQPYFPPSNVAGQLDGVTAPEPSQRVRAAMRNCLKDDHSQVRFVRLYMNSISIEFNRYFSSRDLVQLSFIDFYRIMDTIVKYYDTYITAMKLNDTCKDLFRKNLNSLFHHHLLGQNSQVKSHFLGLLRTFVHESLFEAANLLNGILGQSEANVVDVITLLYAVNFGDEVNLILIQLSIQKVKTFISQHCRQVWDKPLLDSIYHFILGEIFPNFSLILKCSPAEQCDDFYLYELIKIAQDELVSLRISEIYDIVVLFPATLQGLEDLHQCLLMKYKQTDMNLQSPQTTRPQDALDRLDPSMNRFGTRQDVSMDRFGLSGPRYNSTWQLFQTMRTASMDSSNADLSKFSHLANYSLKTQAFQRAKLVDTFILACGQNLLHAGANTVDVITAYTKTIKAFLIIDPKGVLLDKVVRPIRQYLKTREDVIVKVVHGLLDENYASNQLVELVLELRNSDNKKREQPVEDTPDLNWFPDPIDALPDFKKGRVTDVIESLVSIFDSREVFIEEFTKVFGERLMQLDNYDTSDIVAQLGLLKARFGKNEFAVLDVMLRDIYESKQLDQAIGGGTYHASILSHLYWPTVLNNINAETDHFELPQSVQTQFEQFNKQYSSQKPGRQLKVVPSMGVVNLELVINNRPVRFKVSPDQASIISLFDNEHNELSVDHIATTLKMSRYRVTKGLEFWTQKKVLLELTKTLYIVNEDEEEEEEYVMDPMAAVRSQVSKILQDITSLSFERIKSLLKLTMPKDKVDMEQIGDELLKACLDGLVQEDVLMYSDGTYKIRS